MSTTPQAGQLLTRAATIEQTRETEDGAREFVAIGVPYGQRIDVGWWREEFAPGSVSGSEGAVILYGHNRQQMPVGRVIAARDTEAGHQITARLSDTEAGREAHTLLQDGVLRSVSIGFRMSEYTVREEDDGEETVIVTRAEALEFSLTPFPAYPGAAVEAVRHNPPNREDPIMGDTNTLTRADLDTALEDVRNSVSGELEQLQRTVALGGRSAPDPAEQYRSMGEYMQAAARGEDAALELHRAVTSADVPAPMEGENFVGTQARFVSDRRRVTNAFTRAVLPEKGLTVDYAQLDHSQSSIVVGKQSAELANLPGPSVVKFVNKSAPVETFGGYTTVSRQVVERAAVPYLDTLMRGMTIEYARQTEAEVRSVLSTQLDDRVTLGGDAVLTLPGTYADATVADWAGVIVDSGDVFEDLGYSAAGLAVSSDLFKQLAQQTASDGRPLMNLTGSGVNVAGTMDLPNGDGELLRVRVLRLPKMTGRAFFYDPAALEVRESAGAPFALQDDNVIQLGRDFSLYGYLAVTVPFPDALLPVVETTV